MSVSLPPAPQIQGLSRQALVPRVIMGTLTGFCVLIGIISGLQALEWVHKPFPGFLLNQRMVVPGVLRAQWTGYEAGLRDFERVLSVNGQTLASFKELLVLIAERPMGTPLTYEIQGAQGVRSLSIPTMKFSLNDFLVMWGIPYIVGWTFLGLGVVVYVLKPEALTARVFGGACFLFALFELLAFDIVAVHGGFLSLFFLASGFLPAAGLHLSLLFPEPATFLKKRPWLQWVPYGVATGLLIPLLAFYPGPIFLMAYTGVFYTLVLAALALVVSPIVTFFRKSSILAQQRAKVVLWGALFAFPIPALGQLAMFTSTSVGGYSVHPSFSGLPIVVFPMAITYAIAQHNLFDVDVYIKRAVGYVLMTVIVAAGYFSIQTVLQAFVLKPLLGEGAEQVYPLIFALLVVFLFNPVYRTVQDLVDRMFFRKQFDYKATITKMADTLTSLFQPEAIVETLVNTVRGQMYVDMAGVLLFRGTQEPLSLFARKEDQLGNAGGMQEVPVPSDDPLFALIQQKKTLVTKYDIEEDPAYASFRETVGPRFAELNASMAVPLLHNEQVTGLLALGYKKSGHFYSREDVELLGTLANQGAVALENARLIDRMKQEEQVRGNLARYLSPQIVERVMQKDVKVNLGGDRKVVTILFSDIRDFTTISETWPPDQLVTILNEYFTAMAEIIFQFHGSLDKYIGDAIVAVFGSLVPLPNPSLAAVRAAVAMMERLKDLNAQWEARYGVSIEIGIGINTGEVFLGNVGSPDRMEFTVIGDTVNVASRFSGLATAGQVLVTREAFEKLGRAVPYRELAPATVKGKKAPLEVFEIALSV